MRIEAKLRSIGNSMGVILPTDVITGREKGDVITIDVITNKTEALADVITPAPPPKVLERVRVGIQAAIDGQDERTYANAVESGLVAVGCNSCKLLSYQQGKGMSCPRGSHVTAAASVFEAEVNPDADREREGS